MIYDTATKKVIRPMPRTERYANMTKKQIIKAQESAEASTKLLYTSFPSLYDPCAYSSTSSLRQAKGLPTT
jgi:hypothetical protein